MNIVLQDPSRDTEWNDALRRHGIIPEKKEITEEQIVSLVDEAAKKRLEPQVLILNVIIHLVINIFG